MVPPHTKVSRDGDCRLAREPGSATAAPCWPATPWSRHGGRKSGQVFFPHRFTQTWMGNTWKKHGETLWLLITNDYYMLLLENHQDLLFCWVWTLDPFISNVVLIYVQRTMTGSSELIRTDLSVFKETNLSGNVSTSYSIVRFLDLLRDLSRVL